MIRPVTVAQQRLPQGIQARITREWMETKLSSSLYNFILCLNHFRHFRALATTPKFKRPKPGLIVPLFKLGRIRNLFTMWHFVGLPSWNVLSCPVVHNIRRRILSFTCPCVGYNMSRDCGSREELGIISRYHSYTRFVKDAQGWWTVLRRAVRLNDSSTTLRFRFHAWNDTFCVCSLALFCGRAVCAHANDHLRLY